MTAILQQINRAYRFVGQTVFWIMFGVIGLIVGFLVMPILLLTAGSPAARQAAARQVISACFGLFVWVACGMRLISCSVSGMEHFKPDGGQLILANHPTLIDVVILLSLFPQVECVIKEAVTKNPFMRTTVGSANYISNEEPAELLQNCVLRLRAGSSLLLFPEGTRTAPGKQPVFKPGAAEVALRSNAEILPVIVDCRPQFLAKHEPWYYIPIRAPHFDVRVLAPMSPREFVASNASPRQARNDLNKVLETLFVKSLV